MSRVIAVTPNPALDHSITVDRLSPDSTHRINTASRKLGGKGINVASVAVQQGYSACALGPLSEADLERYGRCSYPPDSEILPLQGAIDRCFSTTSAALRCTWAIHERSTDATYILNEPGRAHGGNAYADITSRVASLVGAETDSVVTVSGSLPVDCPPDFLSSVVSVAHEHGSQIIVDTSGDDLLRACEAGADLVKPNAEELYQTTGISDPWSAAHVLLASGAHAVLASLGPEGLLLVTADDQVHARLDRRVEGNPTGAGDAAVAAVATSIIDRLSPTDMLRRAICWSASAVTTPVAGEIGANWEDFNTHISVTHHPLPRS